jgi:murein DD-endopeptidase MepM/ murein hydrolase activator NlpD
MDERAVFGNHVVLEHGDGEFSVLAHLRHGSVAVEAGDRVRRGQRLGACGNSGRSSEPHLHYHLQDGPVPGRAAGLPAIFRGYLADGEPVGRGEPIRGQTVRPASPRASLRAPSAGTRIASVGRTDVREEPQHREEERP